MQITRKVDADDLHRVTLTGATVEVVAGKDQGVKADIGPSGLVVGSGTTCDLQLDDDLVSRRHLELRAEEAGVSAIDLNSTNGTQLLVGGQAGVEVKQIRITQDTRLSVGNSTLAVNLSAQPLDVTLSPRRSFGAAVAESRAMRHVFSLLERAARTEVTVLLEGDSGTGKDVLATALHDESPRVEGPFVVVDCGAIVEGLIESELFGHEPGAFTGASARRQGAFEQAQGGTLFLDEVGELPLESQPKLLRALESRRFRRVGGNETIEVDVRVVAATNRRLREEVRHGAFREDLFYRLAVVHVSLPRLSDRPEDVLPLARRFLRAATGQPEAEVPAALADLLLAYPWPGNARELRNVIERFATFEEADGRLMFGERRADERATPFGAYEGQPYHDAKRALVEDFHRHVLPRALAAADGSVAEAARQLGLPRQSLHRMLKQLEDDAG